MSPLDFDNYKKNAKILSILTIKLQSWLSDFPKNFEWLVLGENTIFSTNFLAHLIFLFGRTALWFGPHYSALSQMQGRIENFLAIWNYASFSC